MNVDNYFSLMNRIIGYLALLMVCVSCSDFIQAESPTRPSVAIASVTPVPTIELSSSEILFPDKLYDALPVMQGICFESAWDAAGTIFIMRSAEEHIRFYDAADNSKLCRRAVERYPFDFSQGDVLAGLWNRGIGCTAKHDITAYQRNDAEHTIEIAIQFSTEGSCNYELVRGFWLGIPNAQNYDITINWSK